MSELRVEDFIDPMDFFQGVHDAPSLQLDANHTARRTKVRASSLTDCARSIALSLAGALKTNDQRWDRGQVAQQYANEQGRMSEELSFTALEWQPNRETVICVVSRQIALPEDFPLSGHPDGELVWLTHAGESEEKGWHQSPAYIPPERFYFTPAMFGRAGDERYRIGVEHKHPGANTYGRVLKNGLLSERPGWVAQGIIYGVALDWDYVLLIDVSLDATALKSRGMGYTKVVGDDPLRAKLNAELMDLSGPKAVWWPDLKNRAEAIAAFINGDGDPDDVRREYTGQGTFPCGYCEMRDRCNAFGDGTVVMPPVPEGLRGS